MYVYICMSISLSHGVYKVIVSLSPAGLTNDRIIPFIKQPWDLRRVTALLTLAIVCMALELAGLLSGYTIHQKNANIVSAMAHLGGFLLTMSMVLNGWTIRVYPYVFTICRCVRGRLQRVAIFPCPNTDGGTNPLRRVCSCVNTVAPRLSTRRSV